MENYLTTLSSIDESEAAFNFTQIICESEVIHKSNIVLRDIKPQNLLFKENNIFFNNN